MASSVSPPPSYTETVMPEPILIDAAWRPTDDLAINTDNVPVWPMVRPFFGPDGKTAMTFLSKFDNHVFFNGGFSAGKGSEGGISKNVSDWKRDNKSGITKLTDLAIVIDRSNVGVPRHCSETGVCKGSSDWLFRGNTSKIKKLPKHAGCTHNLSPDLAMFRGTWMALELAPAFLRYCFPSLRQFWDSIMMKSHLGQMDFFPKLVEIADQGRGDGAETQRVAIDMEEYRCAKRPAPPTETIAKRVRKELQPVNIEYWRTKRNGGSTAIQALELAERAVKIMMERAIASNPEVLVERAKGDNIVKEMEKTIQEEAAKRETIDRQIEATRATAQVMSEMQAHFKGIDVQFIAWRQLNYNMSITSAAGPCVYALFAQNYLKVGHTGNSLFERYKRDLWSHDMKELVMICMPHKDKKEAKRFENLVHQQLKEIQCKVAGKRELFALDYQRVAAAFKAVYGDDDIFFL